MKQESISMKKFENQITTTMNMGLKSMLSMLKDAVIGKENRKPAVPIQVEEFKADEMISHASCSTNYMVWTLSFLFRN